MPHCQYADEYAFRVNLTNLLFEQMTLIQNKPMKWHLKCWRQYLETVHDINNVPLEATAMIETICNHNKAKEMYEHLQNIKQLMFDDRDLLKDEIVSESDASDVENDDIHSDNESSDDDGEEDEEDEEDEETGDEEESSETDDEEESSETDEEDSDQSEMPMEDN